MFSGGLRRTLVDHLSCFREGMGREKLVASLPASFPHLKYVLRGQSRDLLGRLDLYESLLLEQNSYSNSLRHWQCISSNVDRAQIYLCYIVNTLYLHTTFL